MKPEADILLARAARSTPGHGSARLLPWRLSLTRLTEDLAWTARSTPGHGSARLVPWRLSLTRLTEDQLSDPKGDLNVLSPWTSRVSIPTDLTIAGGANDVWIFHTSGDPVMTAAKNVTLGGGAQAKTGGTRSATNASVPPNERLPSYLPPLPSPSNPIYLGHPAPDALPPISINPQIPRRTASTPNRSAV